MTTAKSVAKSITNDIFEIAVLANRKFTLWFGYISKQAFAPHKVNLTRFHINEPTMEILFSSPKNPDIVFSKSILSEWLLPSAFSTIARVISARPLLLISNSMLHLCSVLFAQTLEQISDTARSSVKVILHFPVPGKPRVRPGREGRVRLHQRRQVPHRRGQSGFFAPGYLQGNHRAQIRRPRDFRQKGGKNQFYSLISK